ncbi:hypothetical protein L345_04527, partial [Ophiophagus hannah]
MGELREYFTQFGPVKKCILPFNTETGFHKGFGWIGFATEESRNNALLKDHMFEGSQNHRGYWATWISGKAPPSPKSYTEIKMNRLPIPPGTNHLRIGKP